MIDLGQTNAQNTQNRKIFKLATAQDQTYWPDERSQPGAKLDNPITTGPGAGETIAALNNRSCDPESPPCLDNTGT